MITPLRSTKERPTSPASTGRTLRRSGGSSVANYLERDERCSSLLRHAHRIRQLDAALHHEMPGLPARVVNIKGNRIVILADHGAAAARLRQCQTRLETLFQCHPGDCSPIQIKIQPRPKPPSSHDPTAKPLSSAGKAILGSLAQQLGNDSPLANALERFCERAPIQPNQPEAS